MPTPAETAQSIVDDVTARGTIAFTGSDGPVTDRDVWRAIAVAAIERDREELLKEIYRQVLSFDVAAIRDHFEVDGDQDPTAGLTDDELFAVGQTALQNDRLYEAFHEVLVDALENRA